MSELEQQFHRALMSGVEVSRKKYKYNPTYFVQMLMDRGALATARQLISTDNPSEGFTKLWEYDKRDGTHMALGLTVEAIALKEPYRSLFTDEELALARDRLVQYGYPVDKL